MKFYSTPHNSLIGTRAFCVELTEVDQIKMAEAIAKEVTIKLIEGITNDIMENHKDDILAKVDYDMVAKAVVGKLFDNLTLSK